MNPEDNTNLSGASVNGADQTQADVTDAAMPETPVTASADAASDGAGFQASPVEPPVKKNKKPLLIGGIAAAAVLIILAAVLVPKLLVSDKSRVASAFANLAAETKNVPGPAISGYLGYEQLLEQKSSSMEINLNLEEMPDSPVGPTELEGTGIQYLMKADEASERLLVKANLKFGTIFSIGASANWKDDKIYVEAPDLFDGSLSMGTQDIKGQIEQSIFADSFDLSTISDDLSLDYNTMMTTEETTGTQKAFAENLKARYVQAWSPLWEQISVQKTGEEQEYQIGGQAVAAKNYEILVPKASYTEFLRQIEDFLTTDPSAADFFKMLAVQTSTASSAASVYGISADQEGATGASLQEDLKNAIEEHLTAVNATEEDLKLYAWVTKDQRVARVHMPALPVADDAILGIDAELAGAGRLVDQTNVTLTSSNSLDPITVEYSRTADETKKSSSIKVELTDSEYDDSYSFAYNGSFNATDGAYLADITLSDSTSTFACSVGGSFADVTPGEAFTLYMDDLTLSFKDEYEDLRIVLSGDYHQEPLTETIEDPAPEAYEFLKMTEDDVTALMMEIMGNAYGLFYSVGFLE